MEVVNLRCETYERSSLRYDLSVYHLITGSSLDRGLSECDGGCVVHDERAVIDEGMHHFLCCENLGLASDGRIGAVIKRHLR